MGVYAQLEKKFETVINKKEKALLKKEKDLHQLSKDKVEKKYSTEEVAFQTAIIEKEYSFTFTPMDNAVLELLSGKKTAKVHVHKEDDVLYLIEFSKKYNIKVTAEHTGDVFHKEIFNELADAEIPIVYGPLGSVGYKVELKHAYYQNAVLLMKSKAFYGLMTDHPVIWTPFCVIALNFSLFKECHQRKQSP